MEYSREYKVRKVNDRGFFNLMRKRYFIGNPFAGYSIGIHYQEKGKPEIWFALICIGYLEQEIGIIEYNIKGNVNTCS